MKNTLGPTIKALRRVRGMTQEELALAVGLTRTSIVQIENQKQAVTDMTVAKIAEALGYRVVVKFEKL